jgi:DNA-binding NarL/FixJ family response regulator
MVTHSDLQSDEQAAIKAGATSFLHKETDIDQFEKDIERILDRWLEMHVLHQ